MPRKRKTYPQQTVLAYMKDGESYADAKKRLDDLWKKGEHPSQIEQQRRSSTIH